MDHKKRAKKEDASEEINFVDTLISELCSRTVISASRSVMGKNPIF